MATQNHLLVCVTGAAGRIAYSIYDRLCAGFVFGPKTTISLVLYDIPQCEKILKGLQMEIHDCAYTHLKGIKIATNSDDAFKDVDVCIFLGGFPRKPGMSRADLLKINTKIFMGQAVSLNKYAKKTCHSIVIANPANTMTAILSKHAPNIPDTNFSALTRLDQNRATYRLSQYVGCDLNDVSNMIVWGNHSPTMFPDIIHAKIKGSPVTEDLDDPQTNFVDRVAKRGSEVLQTKGFSSVFPAGKALCDCLHDWYLGSGNKTVSMAVKPKETYGIGNEDIYVSLPVKCLGNWKYKIDEEIEHEDMAQMKIMNSVMELEQQFDQASNAIKPKL